MTSFSTKLLLIILLGSVMDNTQLIIDWREILTIVGCVATGIVFRFVGELTKTTKIDNFRIVLIIISGFAGAYFGSILHKEGAEKLKDMIFPLSLFSNRELMLIIFSFFGVHIPRWLGLYSSYGEAKIKKLIKKEEE